MSMKKAGFAALCALVFLRMGVFAAGEWSGQRLDDLGLSLDLPAEWAIFTPDTPDDDPGLALLGADGETLRATLKAGGVRLNAVQPDLGAEITVVCTEDQRSRSAFDYNLITEEDLNEQGQSVIDYDFSEGAQGMRYVSFEQMQGEQARFLRFVGEIEGGSAGYTQFIQYSTVLNGTAVSVTLHSFGQAVSGEQQDMLQSIVDSMRWDEVRERSLSGGMVFNLVLLVLILGGLIASTVFFSIRYRRTKKAG